MKKIAALCMLASLFVGACTMSTLEPSGSAPSDAGERALTGSNGTLEITGMTGTAIV